MFMGIGLTIGSIQSTSDTNRKILIVQDMFDRPDNSTLMGIATSGQTWVQAGNMGVINKQAYMSSGSLSTAYINALTSDVTIMVTETQRGETSRFSGILFRFLNSANYFRAVVQDSNLFLQRIESGATTTLASKGITRDAGMIISVKLAGAAITVLINDVVQFSVNSTFNQTVTRHGLITAALNARYKNFSIRK